MSRPRFSDTDIFNALAEATTGIHFATAEADGELLFLRGQASGMGHPVYVQTVAGRWDRRRDFRGAAMLAELEAEFGDSIHVVDTAEPNFRIDVVKGQARGLFNLIRALCPDVRVEIERPRAPVDYVARCEIDDNHPDPQPTPRHGHQRRQSGQRGRRGDG